jgi:hypothetical protein
MDFLDIRASIPGFHAYRSEDGWSEYLILFFFIENYQLFMDMM